MATATEELDDINRIHDDAPQLAAARLRALDVTALPSDQLPLAAFLFNHVLGEKLGDWNAAAQRIDHMRRQRSNVPPAVLVHAAVADELAGRGGSDAHTVLLSATSEAVAACAIGLRRLSFTQERMDPLTFAAALHDLALSAAALEQGTPFDTQLAAGLNNATSRLLDIDPDVRERVVADALLAGAAQALRFWQAAGTWVNHERALYLVTLAANRVGAYKTARDAARQALNLIAANGNEDVDRAFLLLQLSGAQQRLGDDAASRTALRDAKAIATTWTDASLTEWFVREEARLNDASVG
ncbi:MAG: hypothetical protein NT024_06450 [Proteobacteria bacterium]|nr:hypothetical protein [Pseudomonadota bacterium]